MPEIKNNDKKMEAKKLAETLKNAKDILEHKADGIVLVMKATKQKDGLEVSGSCQVYNVPQCAVMRVVQSSFKLDPLELMLHSVVHKN